MTLRLANQEAIEEFRAFFLRHGALGFGHPDVPVLSDISLFRVIPLVFGLMPVEAIYRSNTDMHVKPSIRKHLSNIGVSYDEQLVSIVKSISDQYYYTSSAYRSKVTGSARKYTIRDVCASKGRVYREIKIRQKNRCAYCGALFNGGTMETLDHIIPYRLVGDVSDGSNWRIACEKCNTGKSSIVSIVLANEYHNWIYGDAVSTEVPDSVPSLRTRYVVLARDRRCSIEGCLASAASSELRVQRVVSTGLNVADCCSTLCEEHSFKDRPAF